MYSIIVVLLVHCTAFAGGETVTMAKKNMNLTSSEPAQKYSLKM